MLPRHADHTLHALARSFPVLAITGPRQSGKTTLEQRLWTGAYKARLLAPTPRRPSWPMAAVRALCSKTTAC